MKPDISLVIASVIAKRNPPQAWRITEFKDSRGGSSPFERKMWLMLVGLLLSLLELSKLILFALHRPGPIDLFGIGGVTLLALSGDHRTISAKRLTFSRAPEYLPWALAKDSGGPRQSLMAEREQATSRNQMRQAKQNRLMQQCVTQMHRSTKEYIYYIYIVVYKIFTPCFQGIISPRYYFPCAFANGQGLLHRSRYHAISLGCDHGGPLSHMFHSLGNRT